MAAVADRKIIKIAVTSSAKAVIESFAAKHDMKEQGLASRIYEWFARQDDIVRKGVLNLLPEGYEANVARLALEQIVKEAEAAGKQKGSKGGKKPSD